MAFPTTPKHWATDINSYFISFAFDSGISSSSYVVCSSSELAPVWPHSWSSPSTALSSSSSPVLDNFGHVKYSHHLAVRILLLPLSRFQPHTKSKPRKGYIILLEHYFKLLKKIKYGSKRSKTYTLKFSNGGLQRTDLFFFFARIAFWYSALCLHPLQLVATVCMEDEAVPYAAKLSEAGSSGSWIVGTVTEAEVDWMFITSSPEVDSPGKAVGICMSLETASDSAPWSKDVVPSEAGSKVAGTVDEEGFFFLGGRFTFAIASCFN